MVKFKKDDRVRVRKDSEDIVDENCHGIIGTVVIQEGTQVLIDYGEGFNGHSGRGRMGKTTGWFIRSEHLEIITKEEEMKPSIEMSEAYLKAFDWLNDRLFDGTLSRPMLCISRNSSIIGGYFSDGKWHNEQGVKVHEIAINSNHMDGEDIVKLMHILVHEMVHQWQYEFGKPTRSGYHNKQWIEKAVGLGLNGVNDKGEKNKPGQAVKTDLRSGGLAESAIADLPEDAIFPWMTVNLESPDPPKPGAPAQPPVEKRSGKRNKYTCPVCGLNVWAKSGANIACLDCDKSLVEQTL